MSGLADLVGAIRLSTGAHRRVAGTDAVTDLLVLRRRPGGVSPGDERWVRTELVDVDGEPIRLNSYLAAHPQQILGELAVDRGLYREAELIVKAPVSDSRLLPEVLGEAIRQWGQETAARITPYPDQAVDVEAAAGDMSRGDLDVVEAPEGLWDGHLVPLAGGEFAVIQEGVQAPFDTPRAIRAELGALCGLRDRARRLLSLEAESFTDTAAIASEREPLAHDYQAYVRRWAPINRFSERRTGRIDPETDEERTARVTPAAIRALRADPFGPLVISLEVFDEETGSAEPAALLRQRVIAPRAAVTGADTPQDALAVCLDTHGHVDLDTIAALLGATPEQARDQLRELYDVLLLDTSADIMNPVTRWALASGTQLVISTEQGFMTGTVVQHALDYLLSQPAAGGEKAIAVINKVISDARAGSADETERALRSANPTMPVIRIPYDLDIRALIDSGQYDLSLVKRRATRLPIKEMALEVCQRLV